jgi:Tfp pilus assembly PilM family ATPase
VVAVVVGEVLLAGPDAVHAGLHVALRKRLRFPHVLQQLYRDLLQRHVSLQRITLEMSATTAVAE